MTINFNLYGAFIKSGEQKDTLGRKTGHLNEIRQYIKEGKQPPQKYLIDRECTVYLRFTVNRKHNFRVRTMYRLKPRHWDFVKDRARPAYPGATRLNASLERMKVDVREFYTTMLEKHPGISFKNLRENISSFVKGQELPIEMDANKSFWDIWNEFVEVKQGDVSQGTIKSYKGVANSLKKFEINTGYKIDFASINMVFLRRYKTFLLERNNTKGKSIKYGDETGFCNDTINKHISIIKHFMGWAYEEERHTNEIHKKKSFIVHRQPRRENIVYLTEEELTALYNFDFSQNIRREQVRDMFCFLAFTGQRWSDLVNFKKSDLNGNTWAFKQYKGRKRKEHKVSIPMVGFAAPAMKILQKYNFEFPKIVEQNFNDIIKEVCQEVGINKLIEYKSYRGGREIIVETEKYNLISSHVGRRTFTTIMLQKGVPPSTVMEFTGHEDLKTVMKYLGDTTQEQKKQAMEMAANPDEKVRRIS